MKDVQNAINAVMRQNQRTLSSQELANGKWDSVEGAYKGRRYHLGFGEGVLGQFYPTR